MARVTYDPATKQAAIAQALLVGVTAASKTVRVDRHTLSAWLADASAPGSTAPGSAVVVATAEDAAAKFEAIIDAGTSAILERITSPTAAKRERLADIARAVEIAVSSGRLLRGQSSVNVAVNGNAGEPAWLAELDDDQRHNLANVLDAEAAERGVAAADAWIADTVVRLQADPLGLEPAAISKLIGLIELRLAGRNPKYYPPDLLEAADANPE